MTSALPKHYNFTDIEQKHDAAWRASNAFAPNLNAAKAHAIMMPPPNVTGTLHLGHALDNTLPDILTRRARMQGKAATYQPGTDHASIAVHVVLERQLKEEGQTRFDLGREKFLEKAWTWKEHSQGTIKGQMHRLGISADWSNERFTMDDHYATTIENVFITLYNRGLIYRGQRLVNWDPNMQTAVSDLEVKHKEVQGHLWHFKYPYADGFTYTDEKTGVTDGIVVATTRPETILADGAIAINPEDPRAKDLVGKTVIVPIIGREIPIIADTYVDPDFGSGMVKITAAHDFNDFEVYNRHKDSVNIPLINLMNKDATMNANCPAEYQGLDRFVARQKIISDFKQLGLHVKTEDYTHQVPTAERDDTILEPFLTQQWFVKGQPLAEKILKGYANGDFKCLNTRDEKVMTHWLNNIQDWCISRQLWWGHRIPAYFKEENGETQIFVGTEAPDDSWTQDEDIFDTWFSSAIWPFATQHWNGDDTDATNARLNKLFPGEVIMNGRDILPFWDIRMLMMSYELTGQAPFKTIYTHGMILDEHGQKMSKSKGNVVDPMTMVDTYGADALRFTMASITSSEDMRFSEQKVEQNRNFCTKIWNAARYLEMMEITLSGTETPPETTQPVNQWLIAELKAMLTKLDDELNTYQFNQAAHTLYHFTWGTWCDWFLEMTKPLLRDETTATETKATLAWGFNMLLRALHPIIPFITEEVWQSLNNGAGDKDMLLAANWPAYQVWETNPQAAQNIIWLQTIISSLRNARSESKVPPKARIALGVKGASESDLTNFQALLPLLTHLAGIESVSKTSNSAGQTDATAIAHGFEMILPLEGIVDFAAEKERLAKEKLKLEAELAKIEGLLGSESFRARAPEHVVAQNQARAQELQDNIKKLA